MHVGGRGSWWFVGVALGCSSEGSSGSPPMTMLVSGDVAPSNAGPPEAVYELARRTEIEIELSSSDWDALRHEGRSMAAITAASPQDSEYGEYFAASRWTASCTRAWR